MDLQEVYKKYPTKNDCLQLLEHTKWSGKPRCPYCQSLRFTTTKEVGRYHCNKCGTSYSVTVRTGLHNSKIDLQKWFLAIHIFFSGEEISARKLGERLVVTKDTALLIIKRIQKDIKFLNQIEI